MIENANITKAWLSLLKVSNSIKKSIDQQFRAQFNISISRFDVLSALQRGGRNGLRAGDLSRELIVSDGNTTQIMGKLVRDGLVFKRTDPKDARAVIYSLSDEGVSLFSQMAVAHSKWIKAAFEGLSAEDADTLNQILHQLPPLNHIDKEDVA